MPLSVAPVGPKSKSRDGTAVAGARPGYPGGMSDPLQNDPDRAGGLISDAQGEFVARQPGGAFDPRSFRKHVDRGDEAEPGSQEPAGTPPMDDERMSGPGEEIDKAG